MDSEMKIRYTQLSAEHFDAIIDLGNFVHGDKYLDPSSLEAIYQRSFSGGLNASWVALVDSDDLLANPNFTDRFCSDGYLIGFRLTLAATQWQYDEWCTPDEWQVIPEQVCYFKCNTVDPLARGLGIGSSMLRKSIQIAKQQGASAGLAHIWLASPENSAFGYFSASGGQLIKKHKHKWRTSSIDDGYQCPVCSKYCECDAAEMLLDFEA
jgi:ribosomal protein S18 acetylase RimI-like enzyme